MGASLRPPPEDEDEDAVDGRFRPKKRDFFGASVLSVVCCDDRLEVDADARAPLDVAGRRLLDTEGTGGSDRRVAHELPSIAWAKRSDCPDEPVVDR